MTFTNHLDACAIDGRVHEITGEADILTLGTLKLLGRSRDIRTCLTNYFIRSSQGPISVKLYEAPTVTDVGTLLSPTNRNRNSSKSSDTLAYAGATTTGGTLIYQSVVHEIGGGAHVQGGDAEMPSLFVLKDNTDYVFEVYNAAGTTTSVSFSILWCEEE